MSKEIFGKDMIEYLKEKAMSIGPTPHWANITPQDIQNMMSHDATINDYIKEIKKLYFLAEKQKIKQKIHSRFEILDL